MALLKKATLAALASFSLLHPWQAFAQDEGQDPARLVAFSQKQNVTPEMQAAAKHVIKTISVYERTATEEADIRTASAVLLDDEGTVVMSAHQTKRGQGQTLDQLTVPFYSGSDTVKIKITHVDDKMDIAFGQLVNLPDNRADFPFTPLLEQGKAPLTAPLKHGEETRLFGHTTTPGQAESDIQLHTSEGQVKWDPFFAFRATANNISKDCKRAISSEGQGGTSGGMVVNREGQLAGIINSGADYVTHITPRDAIFAAYQSLYPDRASKYLPNANVPIEVSKSCTFEPTRTTRFVRASFAPSALTR